MESQTLVSIATEFGIEAQTVAQIGRGLINRTYLATDAAGEAWIIQALNPIFAPQVNEDIDAVTQHLASKGVTTPRLRRTLGGAAWLSRGGEVFRVLSRVPGETHDRLDTRARAIEAGRLLARFHRALGDLNHRFAAQRLGVHDTAKHLAALSAALAEHRDHPHHADVARLAEEIRAHCRPAAGGADLPERIVHGDPKINNLLFDPDGRAIAFVDLDTVAPMALPLELGDALRSWCNTAPGGEDETSPEFSVALFAAALEGYADGAGAWITGPERAAIVDATHMIMLELAARFAADVLRDAYFGWDPARFASRSAHNLARAQGQVALAASLRAQRATVDRAAASAFAD